MAETLTQRTIVDQLEITRTGTVQIRLAIIVEADGVELSCAYHRTSIEPGGDVDAQIAAVNSHLQSMKLGPIEPDGLSYLKPIVEAAQTKEKIQEFQDARAKIALAVPVEDQGLKTK